MVANFVEVLHGNDGFWIDPDTQAVGLDKGAAIAATTFLANIIDLGVSPRLVTSYSETESFNQFVAGERLRLRSWPYFWRQARLDLDSSVGVAPVVTADGAAAQGCRGGWGFGIPRRGAHPEAAKRAIAFFPSADAQRAFVLDSGHLPSRKALFTDPEIVERYPFFPALLGTIANGSVFRPQIPQYDQASHILQHYLWEVLADETTPAAAIAQAAAETRELLSASPGR
ncbi:hypothetical protein C7271_10150 [filamentous cyanobacterium CCP5]|nr:hypothetical protein C7271_10150 [filamentous cyanobacterium CCP5]